MKILVFSDSHGSLYFMRQCIQKICPNVVIHLGDHYDDAETMAEEFSQIPFHMVAGNCDRYRCPPSAREMLCYDICGVRLYMTHGHVLHVKSGIGGLIAEARRYEAKAALYGHTHITDCQQLEDGLWVCNPGSCGYGGRTAALIEINEQKIIACRIINQAGLEEFV